MIKSKNTNPSSGPIGIFDSGYGGLTILEKIRAELPEYDYIYLGDNARTPYGTRSFNVVYKYYKIFFFNVDGFSIIFKMHCKCFIYVFV